MSPSHWDKMMATENEISCLGIYKFSVGACECTLMLINLEEISVYCAVIYGSPFLLQNNKVI